MMKTQKLFFEKSKTIFIRTEKVGSPGPGEVLIQATYSAISAGTEMLFYNGNFPAGMAVDVSLKALSGRLAYPLQYGYALVGKVIEIGQRADPGWLNKNVFLFHPHQSLGVVSETELIPIPADCDQKNALFLPNMETAVGCVMDAAPLLGENVIIFGQGIVGLLITALLAQYPLKNLIAVDPVKKRRQAAKAMGATTVFDPQDKKSMDKLKKLLKLDKIDSSPENGADVIFEMSGNPETLNPAIALAGYGGRIIVGSWYGTKTAPINLGDRFHRQRLQLISSQVSTIHPNLRGRWTKKRRLEVVWHWLKQLNPAQLITHQIPFSEAQSAYQLLDKNREETLQVILTYEGEN